MKKLLTLFMCLALVGLYSCGSDDDDGETKQYQQILTRTKSQSGTYPQPGVYVYIFMGGDFTNDEYTYHSGGVFMRDNNSTNFSYQSITSSEGKAAIEANYGNTPYTVVLQRYQNSTQEVKMFYVAKFDNKYVIDVTY